MFGGFRPGGRERMRGHWRLTRGLVIGAVMSASMATASSAATFQLTTGETLEGVIAQIGDQQVSIRSRSSYRLVPRDTIRLIVIERPDGSGVAGTLLAWKDGVYELTTTRGVFRLDDNGVDVSVLENAGQTAGIAPPRPGLPDARAGGLVAGDDLVTRAPAEGGVHASVPLPPLTILQIPPRRPEPEPKPAPARPAAAPKPETPKAETPKAETPKVETRKPEPRRATLDQAAPKQPPAPAVSASGGAGGTAGGSAAQVSMLDLSIAPADARAQTPPTDRMAAAPVADAAPSLRQPPPALPASAPLSDADRVRRHAAYLAALGATGPRPEPGSCALLADMTSPPATAFGRREDREAVVLSAGGQASPTVAQRLAAAFFEAHHTETTVRSEGHAIVTEQAHPRLSLPMRIRIAPKRDRTHALAELDSGRSDLALVVESPIGAVSAALSQALGDSATGALDTNERLIGFDAIALATAPDSPIRSLSPEMLGAILSGRIDDWSMVSPTYVGKPVLYLPPEGSSALSAVLQYADVRRAKPAGARFIEQGEERLRQALADPNGLAIVPWSVLRSEGAESAAVALGLGQSAITLSLDSIRSATYPLIVPVVLRVAREPALPGARQFARFLSGAGGQRAIYSAGLAPVAACDPSTCPLKTRGLEKARMRLRSEALKDPIVETASAPVSVRLERLLIADPAGAPSRARELVGALLADGRPGGALTVRAAAAEGSAPLARIRAEATLLALRCGGRSVARAVFDPFAKPPDGAETAISIIEE